MVYAEASNITSADILNDPIEGNHHAGQQELVCSKLGKASVGILLPGVYTNRPNTEQHT